MKKINYNKVEWYYNIGLSTTEVIKLLGISLCAFRQRIRNKYNVSIEDYIKSINSDKKDGRPKIEIDYDQVKRLCQIFCTQEEICNFFGISVDTIERRFQERYGKTFQEKYKQFSVDGKISLRRKQFKRCEEGSDTMLVWMGKNHLGQKDKNEQEILDHEIKITYEEDN